MPRRVPATIELSRMSGGVDAFNRYAEMGSEKAVEYDNVIEDDGDLRRRDAFKAIGTAAPHFFSPGRSFFEITGGGGGIAWNRTFSLSAATLNAGIPGTNELQLHCIGEQFDGFWWGHVSSVPTGPTRSAKLAVEYWTGAAWAQIPSILDSTRLRVANGNDEWLMSLCKDGLVSWHLSQIRDSWASRTVNTIANVYSVRLRILGETTGSDPTLLGNYSVGAGALAISAPGPQAIKLQPVRSLFPVRMRDGMSAVLIGSDRQVPRGQEPGGMMGLMKDVLAETKALMVLDTRGDEGSGIVGVVTQPDVLRANPGQPTVSGGGTWTTQHSFGTSAGAANQVLKNQQDADARNFYLWYTDQFRGDAFATIIPVVGTITHDAVRLRSGFRYDFLSTARLSEFRTNAFERCKLRCTVNGSGAGTPINEEREIYLHTVSGTSGFVEVHQHFSVAPDNQNQFDVIRPHARVAVFPVTDESTLRRYEVDTNSTTTITVMGTTIHPHVARPTAENNVDCYFMVSRDIQDQLPAGEFWTAAFDITTKLVYMTNGYGVFKLDGVVLRKFFPIIDEENPRVKAWIGALPDQMRDLLRSQDLAGSKLRGNVDGAQIICDFAGRLVLANFADRPNTIVYSAPAPDIDIWPNLYETEIRDQENNEIRSMFTLGGELVVSTPTSMHVASHPNTDGTLRFAVASSGVGFLSHRAVAKLGDNYAIGPSADGLRIFDGRMMNKVVDQWERILPGGVNLAKMGLSCGAAFFRKNQYFLAFPSRGSSVNDKILVYNIPQQKVFIWSAPWGGVADIARDFDERGNERLLFGFNDGHVAVLVDAETDDGDQVTGYAKSPLMQPAVNTEIVASGLLLCVSEADAIEIEYSMNQREASTDPTPRRNFRYRDGDARFGTGVFETAVFSGRPYVTRRIPFQNGNLARGEMFQWAIIGSTRWRLRSAELLLSGPTVQRSGT